MAFCVMKKEMDINMNVYDFDKTIYNGDSTLDFYEYLLKKHPKIIFRLPATILKFLYFKMGFVTKTQFKEYFYMFLQDIPHVDSEIIDFWKQNKVKIFAWYLNQQKKTDVIISASPRFLLQPVCMELGIKNLIASEVDKKTGKYTGENCYGQEKVRRFLEQFPDLEIEEFYSDSKSDLPLAKMAHKSFLVKGEKLIMEWMKN